MRIFLISLFSIFAFSAFADSVSTINGKVPTYKITAEKLDNSRNNLSPKTSGSSFSFAKKDIENLPQGQMTSINQVLLRAPGVAQNSYGQIHVRGDHANLQYRINGVMLPEGISGFGQTLDTHFADKIDFMTGALPAQYGFQTAGVVDIKTKNGIFDQGGRSEVMVGGNETIGLNQQISGSKDRLNYYLSASYLQNNRGIESPTAARNPNHDDTSQNKLFGYFSYLIDDAKRLNFIIANADNRFQVPNRSGLDTTYNLTGYSGFDSNNLREKQRESNRYAIASLQGVSDSNIDYQLSIFGRYSALNFTPDYAGDLMFNGVATKIQRSSFATGTQGDFSYKLDDKNTLRSGFYLSNDTTNNTSNNAVFEADSDGVQTSSNPFNVSQGTKKNSQLLGAYLQNEWKALKKLTINYGLRFDLSRAYATENQLSPRLNAIYELNNKTKIHGGFSRYFTPPPTTLISSNDLSKFQNTTNAPQNFSNGKVRAQRTSYYDLGISHKLNNNLNIGFDTYYKQIHNLLDEGQFGNALIYTPFNYQRGKAYGAEFTLDYQKDNFSSYINLATQKAFGKNVVSGQYLLEQNELDYIAQKSVYLDHSQTYTASAGASYLYRATKYSADVIYGSGLRTGDNNINTMPAYIQFNAHAARDVNLSYVKKINMRFAVVNLFDQVYQLHDGSGIGVAASQYGPRRTFYFIVSKSF